VNVNLGWRIRLAARLLSEIIKKNNRYIFKVVDWSEEIDDTDWFDFDRFADCITWTDEQLKTYRSIRMSYDEWYFERRRDAEKFQVLWALKWA